MRGNAADRVPSFEDIESLQVELDGLANLGAKPTEVASEKNQDEVRVSNLIRNPKTGEWTLTEPDDDSEGMSPRALLNVLKYIGDLKATSPELISKNIRLVARLGSAALWGIIREAESKEEELSEATRREIQELVAVIHKEALSELRESDLPQENAAQRLARIYFSNNQA